MECPRCKKIIDRFPCKYCGHDGEALFKEGGTGGGRP